jgi:hypothetical protein
VILTEIGRETEMLFQLGRGSNYRGVPHARFHCNNLFLVISVLTSSFFTHTHGHTHTHKETHAHVAFDTTNSLVLSLYGISL